MSTPAILLLLCAACVHVGWNSLGKKRNPTPALFLLANTAGMILLSPIVLWRYGGALAAAFEGPLVWLTVATGILQVLYYASLARAYAAGNLTVVYPMARSSAIVQVALLNFALGRGHQISGACLGGIALTFLGCALLPMRSFGDLKLRNYLNTACLYALLASLGTALYTLVDDQGVHCLLAARAAHFSPLDAAISYAFLEAAAASVFLTLYVLLRKPDREELRLAWRNQQGQAWLMGFGIYLAYGLVLLSFAYVRNVSYASAFREIGILLGVVVGRVFLHEKMYPPRACGAVLAFLGLITVALG